MNKVEQERTTFGILSYEGELPDNARIEIASVAARRELQIISWKGQTKQGKFVQLQMEFHGSPLDPVRFSFKGGTTVYGYSNVDLNPFNRGKEFGFDAFDATDIFIITQKALADGVTPLFCVVAFENAFQKARKESAYLRKLRLARELAARKYLP